MHLREEVRQRLGLQVLFDFHDIVSAVVFAHEHGFGALELNLGNIDFVRQLANKQEQKRIRIAARKYRVKLAAHAVEGPSLFIPSPKVVRCAVAEIKHLMDQAKEAGISRVVMHLGFEMRYGMNGDRLYIHEVFPDFYETSIGDTLAELKAYARGRTRLCIENVGGFRFDFVHRIMDRVLGGSLGFCMDVGHVFILPREKQKSELDFFKRHQRHIHESHLHDNHGVRDEHLVLGNGTIDFLPFSQMLANTDAFLIFEVRPKEAALRCLDYFNLQIAPRL
ncbi:hypothetical protein CH330_00145 [candidate division WOR-3 bacterium JGI_Cruoil_03_51_56]|uniref:Xylose isomerase-like TIM barrel domain-containing protein n=1 Tax=candidate division WOR-3 bacterium JGI_Cruoil_03_51_56 TaxID=1973747 RepID=A0A235BYX6_UNCW3|nr:MAG: hypothetical protein CH330_00145 [candidate division WOR-3 bacterium JGI_Cruoil_03_51_56]